MIKGERANVDGVLKQNRDVLYHIKNKRAMRDLKIGEYLEKNEIEISDFLLEN